LLAVAVKANPSDDPYDARFANRLPTSINNNIGNYTVCQICSVVLAAYCTDALNLADSSVMRPTSL